MSDSRFSVHYWEMQNILTDIICDTRNMVESSPTLMEERIDRTSKFRLCTYGDLVSTESFP